MADPSSHLLKQMLIRPAHGNGPVNNIKPDHHLVGKGALDDLDFINIDDGTSVDPPELCGIQLRFQIFDRGLD